MVYLKNNQELGHGVLKVVLLGITLVAQELLVNTVERWEAVALGLLDTIAMVLLVLVVVGVVLALGHLKC